MGLDQYAKVVNEDGSVDEFFYWRKHPNLQGWMENLYRSKGGTEEFNCISLFLNADDLLSLKEDIENDKLPYTQGFFFGESTGDDGEKENDLKFIDLALIQLNKGRKVFYRSSW